MTKAILTIQDLVEGKIDKIQAAIAAGANVNVYFEYKAENPYASRYNGTSPLLIAIIHGHTEIVKLLLNSYANIDLVPHCYGGPYDGLTPLVAAALGGNIEIVELLLDKRADVNDTPFQGHYRGVTPLLAAAEKGHTEIVKLLLERGAKIRAAFPKSVMYDTTPLWWAAARGYTEIVKLLLTSRDVNIEAAPSKGPDAGRTPLFFAVENGRIEVVKLLLEKGADTDYLLANFHSLKPSIKVLSSLADNISLIQDPKLLAMVIELSNKVTKPTLIATPETGDHDISFAKAELKRVKELFAKRASQPTIPTLEEALAEIRKLVIDRILAETPKSNLAAFIEHNKSATELDNSSIQRYITSDNAYHLAYQWLMTYSKNMLLLHKKGNETASNLFEEMLQYVIACRNDFNSPGQFDFGKAKDIEEAIILELSNAMQGNADLMSCVSGTPRFLRVVLEGYLNTLYKGDAVQKQLQLSVTTVIDNLMRQKFAVVKSKRTKNSDDSQLVEQELITICEAMSTIGTDNSEYVLKGNPVTGRTTGEPLSAERLKLRAQIMYETFPTFNSFKDAVVANMRTAPHETIHLTSEMEAYLRVRYIAIVDANIRDKLFETLGSELQRLKLNAIPTKLATEIRDYLQGNLLNKETTKEKLRKDLNTAIELLVGGGMDFTARDKVVDCVLANFTSFIWPNQNSYYEAQAHKIFKSLKSQYEQFAYPAVDRKRPSAHT